jgi:hypothetical protein
MGSKARGGPTGATGSDHSPGAPAVTAQ